MLTGTHAYCANAPPLPAGGGGLQQDSQRPMSAITASPTLKESTPSPRASTVPAISKPGVYGKVHGQTPSSPPEKSFQSIGLQEAISTFTRTSPFAGSGTGISSSLRALMAAAGSPPSPYALRRQAWARHTRSD